MTTGAFLQCVWSPRAATCRPATVFTVVCSHRQSSLQISSSLLIASDSDESAVVTGFRHAFAYLVYHTRAVATSESVLAGTHSPHGHFYHSLFRCSSTIPKVTAESEHRHTKIYHTCQKLVVVRSPHCRAASSKSVRWDSICQVHSMEGAEEGGD